MMVDDEWMVGWIAYSYFHQKNRWRFFFLFLVDYLSGLLLGFQIVFHCCCCGGGGGFFPVLQLSNDVNSGWIIRLKLSNHFEYWILVSFGHIWFIFVVVVVVGILIKSGSFMVVVEKSWIPLEIFIKWVKKNKEMHPVSLTLGIFFCFVFFIITIQSSIWIFSVLFIIVTGGWEIFFHFNKWKTNAFFSTSKIFHYLEFIIWMANLCCVCVCVCCICTIWQI